MTRPYLLVRLLLVALIASSLTPPSLFAQRRTQTATIAPLSTATPQSVGLAADLPARMDEAMQGLIDKKHLAGIVTLVARKGKVVQHKAYGFQDAEKQVPMRTDDAAALSTRDAMGLQRWRRHPGLSRRKTVRQDIP